MDASQRPYWDLAAEIGKQFSHPVHQDWVTRHIPRSGRILEYGCGYGRVLSELASLGYHDLHGVDFSAAMIDRAREAVPNARLAAIDELPLKKPAESFDAIFLFAVLTCIPADADLRALMSEVSRLLRPQGIVYVSDLPLQTDAHHGVRYQSGLLQTGKWGVFSTTDGAIVRHFASEEFLRMFAGFDLIEQRRVDVRTMNGTPVQAAQFLLRFR